MTKWPQPHEQISGIQRTRDDLLSIDEAAMQRRVVILTIARELWVSALNGAHLERGRALYERMQYPKVGDLVAETVGMSHPTRPDADGDARALTCFGILLGRRTEWACSDEEWQRYREEGEADGYPMPDESRVTTEAAYVQYGPSPDDICRWVNCSIIALPTGLLHHTADQQP
jgi:hypothetical protein